jgi:RES domain-containing protein
MLGAGDLKIALSGAPFISVKGELYRTVDLQYLQKPYYPLRALFGLGVSQSGARFTPQGGPPSLYMAEDNLTALAEATLTAAAVSGPHPPKVVFTAKVNIGSVLDLTEQRTLTLFGTSTQELHGTWRISTGPPPATQLLGQATYDSGRYMAIRYPSVRRPGGVCLVIFTERLTSPSFVEVYDPHGHLKARIP